MSNEYDSERILRIASRLLELTRQKRADWTVSSRADIFVFSQPRSSVVLESRDRDGVAPFKIRVLNEHGYTVESWTFGVSDDGFAIMDALYTEARRSALKTEATLEGLIEDLDNMPLENDT